MTVSSIRKILFITSTRLGDAVISTGILDYLLQTYPQAKFTIACGPVAAGLFDAMPRRDKTLVMNKYRFDFHWLLLWSQCVMQSWDLVIDLRGSGIGYFLRTRKKCIVRGGRIKEHRVHYLARSLSLSYTPLPVVWIDEKNKKMAAEKLPADHYIALAPTANWIGKIWPIERFIQVAKKLLVFNKDYEFVLFYGPGSQEFNLVDPLKRTSLPVIDSGGQNTLTEVAALLSRCKGFIGNDSGLMHLAAACQIPVLGLFGPSKLSEYEPAGNHAQGLSASGGNGMANMENLTVDEVYNAFQNLLETYNKQDRQND
ncbi:glycosyltransferase family 9 protein [Commensalibacter sp. ESL0382]|uniref:glycosyltransferase family 9 protein n=1 Tax=unclassified Commensalibacter TaxID=2630218 RepID=UPI0012D8BC25|nr:glycosyltransferase family 9 protein [Commensalibacter sp. ESL0382]MUG34355.1 glycosyltransferase family 9 protein [Commensalibacter sp. ESL0382]